MTKTGFMIAALDPRGRASRKGFLMIAAALIAIEVLGAALIWLGGFDGQSLPVTALKALFIWAALAGASKRLHDLGLSAWWIPGAVVLQLIWTVVLVVAMFVSFGIEQMQPGAEGYRMMLAGCFAPVFVVALWLYITAGEATGNRYGEAPGDVGLSGPGGSPPMWTTAIRS